MSQAAGALPVVVVLGAGIGGLGVVGALAGHAHLVIVDRDQKLADQAAAVAVAANGSAEAEVVDLTDLAAVEAFRDRIVGAQGQVDAVVHLVGGWRGSTTVDAGAIDAFNALLPGVVTTVQTTSVAFRDQLMASAAGRYVMVTSTAVRDPSAGNAGYAAAKAAAQTWVQALAASFAGSPAQAVTLAVMALIDPEKKATDPHKYSGYTDTAELGAAVAAVITGAEVDNGAYVDLTSSMGLDGLRLGAAVTGRDADGSGEEAT